MSGTPENNGSFNQQNFGYTDGSAQWHYSSQQYNWSSSQQIIPLQSYAQLQPKQQAQMQSPMIQPMLPCLDVGQVNQHHMALQNALLQSAHQMQLAMQGNFNSILPIFQPQQQSLINQHQQPQIHYPQAPVAQSPPQPLQTTPSRPNHQYNMIDSRVDELTRTMNRERRNYDARLKQLEQSQP